jgi:A/G-specific adenine glycosylase
MGKQDVIPPPRRRGPVPLEKRWTFMMQRGNRWLIEQRPATGRWAGLWQFITVPANGKKPEFAEMRRIGRVEHLLSHRRYRFDVFACKTETVPSADGRKRKWVTLGQLAHYPMSKPQLTIAQMLTMKKPILPRPVIRERVRVRA